MTIPEVLMQIGTGLLVIAGSGLVFYVLVKDLFEPAGPDTAQPREKVKRG